jgi:Family of unknown function (DUF5715)
MIMRLNASIPALLALAALYFFPVDSLAKPAHHRVREVTVAANHHSTHHKPVSEPTRTLHHHATSRIRPEAATRVHSQRAATPHHKRRSISSPSSPAHAAASQSDLTASASAPQKATSDDFLKAASTASETQAPVAIHGTSRPDEPSETQPPSSARRPASVSQPVPVISVIRPAAQRPQLPSAEEVAATPVILPALYNKRGRLIVPRPLKGSHEILVHQNLVADHDGLDRIQNDEDLLDMRSQRLLVSLPANNALQIDERLPENRRYCRPWTAQFLSTLARAHYAHFHSPLQVNSAVRTVEFQQHLVHINGNAAPAEGDTASPHLTGQAIDIAKHGLSITEIAWLRGYLLPLVQEGKVDVEEEFQQSCFHISVYRKYMPSAAPNRSPATSHHSETTALAAALR